MMNLVGQVVLTALAKDPDSRFPKRKTFAEVSQQVCESSSCWARSQSLVAEDAKEEEEEPDERPDWIIVESITYSYPSNFPSPPRDVP